MAHQAASPWLFGGMTADGAVIGEIVQLIDRQNEAVKDAASTEGCATQIVLAPHAVCSS